MEPIYTEDQITDMSDQLLRILFQQSQHFHSYRSQGFDFSASFPGTIRNNMSNFILEEIEELGCAVLYSLWTAASLMAFRVFEETVKAHVAYDLDISIKNKSFQKIISHMSETFNPSFVKQLQALRKKRNNGMHPEQRFSREEVIKIIDEVLWIVLYVYSIPVDE